MAAWALCALAGCGPNPSSLEGTAAYEGTPIRTGDIRLDPLEGTPGFAAGAKIVEGQFAFPEEAGLFEGTYMVSISATRPTGRKIKTEGLPGEPAEVDEVVQYVPEEFNVHSELRVKLVPGPNREAFDLKPSK